MRFYPGPENCVTIVLEHIDGQVTLRAGRNHYTFNAGGIYDGSDKRGDTGTGSDNPEAGGRPGSGGSDHPGRDSDRDGYIDTGRADNEGAPASESPGASSGDTGQPESEAGAIGGGETGAGAFPFIGKPAHNSGEFSHDQVINDKIMLRYHVYKAENHLKKILWDFPAEFCESFLSIIKYLKEEKGE